MFNPEMFKLDWFDGTNFTRWKDKILFLLSEVGVAYLLEENLPPLPKPRDEDTETMETMESCKGFTLNLLSDGLYDLFWEKNKKSPQELWKALENKYTSEKQGTDRFLSMKFFEYQMDESKLVWTKLMAY